MSKRMGWSLAVMSMVLFSANTPIARTAMVAGMRPTTLLLFRFIVAIGLFIGMRALSDVWRPQGAERKMDRYGRWASVGSGVANGLTLLFFYLSLTRLPASLSSMIAIGLYPIIVLLILAWRGEKMTGRHILRLVFGIVGLYFCWGLAAMQTGSV